jgi:imidazole glycerol phosphate synthase subunit HisF
MATPGTVIGWLLAHDDRERLLEQYKPRYEKVVAHHVTLKTDAVNDPLPQTVGAQIVGRADDDAGVEAMVVSIDGTTDRPDGSTYHITWSLGDGRRARESNDVLKERGWDEFDDPVPIKLEPGRF